MGQLVGDSVARGENPQMGDAFARVYEQTAHRITGPVSRLALDEVGSVGSGTNVLDIAAGAGALSVPAAERGAKVLATDVAPGMVRRLAERLQGFDGCRAEVMDGEALALPDGAFDATFSVFGTMTFKDWRRGILEQARVTRTGGRACIVTWKEPPGGGPFQILFEALARTFPERPAPLWPAGFRTLADPARLAQEMRQAGLDSVTVREFEATWKGPAGQAYLNELRELHLYVRPYVALNPSERDKVDGAIHDLTLERANGGEVRLTSPVLIAIGSGV